VSVRAERLPIKVYTSADGLAHDRINRILRDSRGFLWFATEEGLSRFDGYRFVNYTTQQGLPHRNVNDILETRNGIYFIATSNGVGRFIQTGSADSRFVVYRPNGDERARLVSVIVEDRAGVIWCGTAGGLYQLVPTANGEWTFQIVDIGLSGNSIDDYVVYALLADRNGALWIGTGSGLYRRWPDGRVERYTVKQGLPSNFAYSLLEDTEGRVWVGMWKGLCRLISDPDLHKSIVARLLTQKDGLGERVVALFQSSDGRLWANSSFHGLNEVIFKESEKPSIRSYTTAHGLSSDALAALAEDLDGNLWLGTESSGAMKLMKSGFTTYDEADGLGSARINAIVESEAGELCAISADLKTTFSIINSFDGNRFGAIHPLLPRRVKYGGWGSNQITFQDHTGEWWVPTGEGLCRFPKVARIEDLARTPPRTIYTTRDGLVGNNIFHLYEDRRGDIWISTTSPVQSGLARWDRATDTIQAFTETDGLPKAAATAFAEDSAGNLWLGFLRGGLVRYRDRKFESFRETDGLPAGTINALYIDQSGRLWIATTNGGASRVDDPRAYPHFVTFDRNKGLSSDSVLSITEDQWGRIYLGTGRGINRLDPKTGAIDEYTISDGLPNSYVEIAFRDRHGALWFGTPQGLSRLVAEPEHKREQPPIMISGLRVGGISHPISELGEKEVSKLELGRNQNQIQIDFVGLGFGLGEELRYQYKLEGADRDWSAPTDQRTITYANLAPGVYRFLVRAVSSDGGTSLTPASVAFTISPPIWRQWWFIALIATTVGLIAYALHRQRVARLVELERVRTRIASDLHDDIGSSLSQVAVLSEVLRKQIEGRAAEFARPLAQIARVSREAVDSMSDIVWAINPQKDHLYDLTRRMRRLVSELFPAQNIEFRFRAPGNEEDVGLGADLRRQVFLIFKESVNNIIRHSKCAHAEIEIRLDGAWLVLETTDDGCGFDPASTNAGNGLPSLNRRARAIGGELEIHSRPSIGTRIVLKVPYESQGVKWSESSKLKR